MRLSCRPNTEFLFWPRDMHTDLLTKGPEFDSWQGQRYSFGTGILIQLGDVYYILGLWQYKPQIISKIWILLKILHCVKYCTQLRLMLLSCIMNNTGSQYVLTILMKVSSLWLPNQYKNNKKLPFSWSSTENMTMPL